MTKNQKKKEKKKRKKLGQKLDSKEEQPPSLPATGETRSSSQESAIITTTGSQNAEMEKKLGFSTSEDEDEERDSSIKEFKQKIKSCIKGSRVSVKVKSRIL